MGDTDRKLFVLDTNILLHEPFAIFSFQEHDVVIPMTVLEELDRIKDSKRDVARDARVAIRALEDLFKDATPDEISEGIPVSKENQTKALFPFWRILNCRKPSKLSPTKPVTTAFSTRCFICKTNEHHEKSLITKTSTCVCVRKEPEFALLKTTEPTNSSTTFNTSLKASSNEKAISGAVLMKLKATRWVAKPTTNSVVSLLTQRSSTNTSLMKTAILQAALKPSMKTS